MLADLKNDLFAHSSHWKIFSKASCWVTETLFQQLYGFRPFRHSISEGVHLQRHPVSELEHQKSQSMYLHLGGGFRRSERKELSWGSSYLLMPGTMKNRTCTRTFAPNILHPSVRASPLAKQQIGYNCHDKDKVYTCQSFAPGLTSQDVEHCICEFGNASTSLVRILHSCATVCIHISSDSHRGGCFYH